MNPDNSIDEEHKAEIYPPPHKKVKINQTESVQASNTPAEILLKKELKEDVLKRFQTIDSNLTSQPESQPKKTYEKVRAQLEFYLGDTNLRKDKYLRDLISKNRKGYINLKDFLKFNKIKSLLEHLPPDARAKELLTAVQSSHLLKTNKANTMVRRKVAFNPNLTPEEQAKVDAKTVYIENFPENVTHEKIASIFSRVGKVVHVSLPRYEESRAFKGFGFVEFENEKQADAAVSNFNNCLPKEFLEGFEKTNQPLLTVMMKTKWLVLKEEFKKIKSELMQQIGGSDTQSSVKGSNNDQSFIEKDFEIEMGCLAKILNLPDEAERKAIQALVKNYENPEYVDYKKGADCAIVRFANPEACSTFIKKMQEKPLYFESYKLQVEKLGGKEEQAYLEKIKKQRNNMRRHFFEAKKKKKETLYGNL